MLIINNRFLSVYDYNFLLYYEKIFSVKQPKDQRFKELFLPDSENPFQMKKRKKELMIE